MRPVWRALAIILACFFAGALAYRLWADPPDRIVNARTPPVDWSLPVPPGQGLPAADAVWANRGPWGKPPPPPPPPLPPPPPPPPPPPVPAGIIAGTKGLEALFLDSVAGELRLRKGDKFPNGGKITAITPTRVDWVDAAGQKRHHEMLSDPSLATSVMPGANPSPAMQPSMRMPIPPAETPLGMVFPGQGQKWPGTRGAYQAGPARTNPATDQEREARRQQNKARREGMLSQPPGNP